MHVWVIAALSERRRTPHSYDRCRAAGRKSGTRKHISSEGYKIVADFGDQYSDLLGGDAGHQVKIPNPMY